LNNFKKGLNPNGKDNNANELSDQNNQHSYNPFPNLPLMELAIKKDS